MAGMLIALACATKQVRRPVRPVASGGTTIVQRFLLKQARADPPPPAITVVTNWRALLK